MRFVEGIKDNYRKSEAAVYIQNIFEHQKRNGVLIADPKMAANRIVERGWEEITRLNHTKMKPHKLTLAAFSVALSIKDVPITSGSFAPLLICLDFLLESIETNIDIEPFDLIDWTFLKMSVYVYSLKAGPEAKVFNELHRLA